MADWSKYIPTSGEASAQIGLKGRFGGSRMRRFRRRSRFSYSKPKHRWWYSKTGVENGWQAWPQQGETAPSYQMFDISPLELIESGDQEYIQRTARPVRLLMTQGVIMFRMFPTVRGNSAQQSEVNAALQNQFPLMLHWNWVLKRASYEYSVPVQDSFNSSPTINPASDLRGLLVSKRVLSFGMTALRYLWPTAALPFYNTTTTSVGTVPAVLDPNGPQFTYLPRPRIPRRGILFRPGDTLALNVSITNCNFGPINIDDTDLAIQYYTGNFRSLMSES